MSPGSAAAVCEGFHGTLAELLSRDLPSAARSILSSLQSHTEAAVEALQDLSEPVPATLWDECRSN
jgi:hypothetical protein